MLLLLLLLQALLSLYPKGLRGEGLVSMEEEEWVEEKEGCWGGRPVRGEGPGKATAAARAAMGEDTLSPLSLPLVPLLVLLRLPPAFPPP